jgi:hypothetical protein
VSARELTIRLAEQLERAGFRSACALLLWGALLDARGPGLFADALGCAARDVGRALIATPHSRPKRQRRLYRLFYATRYLLDHVTGRGDSEELAFAEDELRRLEDGSLEQQGQGRADWAHEFTEAVADARTLLREGR